VNHHSVAASFILN